MIYHKIQFPKINLINRTMKSLYLLATLFFIWNTTPVFAQADPFGGGGAFAESPFSSPGELPEFKPFVQGLDMNKVRISTIEPFDLKSLIDTRNRMFIIDTREQNEFDVSHLKGAKRVGYNNFSVEKVWMLDRNTTIVLCSSDDLRSKHVGAYMKMMGFVDVRTIGGNIIGWVNAGYALVDKDGHSTTNVFVTNRDDARKLKKGKAIFN
jgi:rhodanese-related sulfurtransferase